MDTVFRKIEQNKEVETAPLPKGKDAPVTPRDDGIDVPYTDYEMTKNHSYLVDYFKLGDNYDVYSDEINSLESYFKSKISDGDIANSPKAVEKELRVMEKLNNVKDDERAVVRVGVINSYIKFLRDTKNIKRYANTQ